MKPLGCFKDKIRDRALPQYYANFRSHIDWINMNATIRQCAHVALAKGYEYFGVQFYGECWSSANAADTYNKHGSSTNCVEGVGKDMANFVYQFDKVRVLPVGSNQL